MLHSSCIVNQPKIFKRKEVFHNMSVPIWEKAFLSLEEGSEYYGIGINRLRDLTNQKECEDCILWSGRKRLIKRKAFEAYLNGLYSI